jgi:hypothetical protein
MLELGASVLQLAGVFTARSSGWKLAMNRESTSKPVAGVSVSTWPTSSFGREYARVRVSDEPVTGCEYDW